MAIYTDSSLINVDMSIWTGKATLKRGEVNDRDLPPEEVATLGSKRLIDPVHLRPFYGIKSCVFDVLNRDGLRFLNGWLVANDKMDRPTQELHKLGVKWRDALDVFMQDYDQAVADWQQEHPEWATMLANATPLAQEVQRRFNFGWQVYSIQPAKVAAAVGMREGNTTEDMEASVAMSAATRMAGLIDEYLKKSENILLPAQDKLSRVADACHALTFTAPELAKLHELLRCLSMTPGVRGIINTVLTPLTDPNNIMKTCDPRASTNDIMENLFNSASAAMAEPDPTPEEPEPETPAVSVLAPVEQEQFMDLADAVDTAAQLYGQMQSSQFISAPLMDVIQACHAASVPQAKLLREVATALMVLADSYTAYQVLTELNSAEVLRDIRKLGDTCYDILIATAPSLSPAQRSRVQGMLLAPQPVQQLSIKAQAEVRSMQLPSLPYDPRNDKLYEEASQILEAQPKPVAPAPKQVLFGAADLAGLL